MEVHSFNTPLKDRVLWYDGESSFKSSALLAAIQHYDIRYVDEITPTVKEYNQHVSKDQEIKVKETCGQLSTTWNLPEDYSNLDVIDYIFTKHDDLTKELAPDEINSRERRLAVELAAFEKRNLFQVIRTLIYIINTLISNNVVWGVGRGSSVSSYVLYVLGAHDVDSYKYGLDIGDFLHD